MYITHTYICVFYVILSESLYYNKNEYRIDFFFLEKCIPFKNYIGLHFMNN